MLKPFDVFVSEDGETYRYLINNAEFFSYVKVVKIDSTTGKTIPASGIGFHIYDPSGNQIQMTFTYPTVTTIDTFYTDGDGMLITPEKLEYGKGYSLVEVSAPYGYVLNSDPVYFDITEDNSTEENAVTVVIVEKENAPQMGVINVEKTGEYLASVVDTKDSKRLVYAVGGLAGAEYTVTAAEDIYTPDGTLRYGKDEVVATLVTKKDGKAVTEPLFLGRYHVVETKAPYGMILNPTVQTVELTYAGQEVEITETSTGFYNERQKIEIDLNKVMEQTRSSALATTAKSPPSTSACLLQRKSLRQMAAVSPLAGCSKSLSATRTAMQPSAPTFPLVQKPTSRKSAPISTMSCPIRNTPWYSSTQDRKLLLSTSP